MSGQAILVTSVGAASGSKAAAAALACAGSEPGRAGLLIDLGEDRAPRPSLIATAAARELEERLVAHLPEARVASRGRTCCLALPADEGGIERIPAALPLARDSVCVIHLPPRLLQVALAEPRVEPKAALLRADLGRDRALTALAARDLTERDIRISVLKRPLGWLTARAALFGALPEGSDVLPSRHRRLLDAADSKLRYRYDREDGPDSDRRGISRQWRPGSDGARQRKEGGPHSKRQGR